MMKNDFYFTLRALFVLKIFKFLSWLFVYVEQLLDQNEKVNFHTEKQTIAMHILPNIKGSKGNQTMKFGQLIEYNMRNIFLKNHTQNVVEKLFPDYFPKNRNWIYLWINSLKFYTVRSSCMPSWVLSKYIETRLQITCFSS